LAINGKDACYRLWVKVGKCALLAPSGSLLGASSGRHPFCMFCRVLSVILLRVASGSQGFRSGAWRALRYGHGATLPEIPPVLRDQDTKAP